MLRTPFRDAPPMPTDARIACTRCHHVLLRCRLHCDVCGHAMPRRVRRRWRTVLARFGLALTAAMALYVNAMGGP
ncbi:hypothetical protein LYSHEL_00210 [Lysobacter helvus]|uniref:Uncharacterized protein n=3 Tax=Lysobacterales TaxID=135614 RepID=A0ABM7Q1C0_9GAMM|nr:hypothetical protein LYSCAS_00210 [Lysobacter caseinilyticus]BCT94150.1 hypothetical protein LYSHEL_00210 [Lysobacter helvus]